MALNKLVIPGITLLLLCMVALAYPSVTMLENTPDCLDCHTTYLICPSEDVKDFSVDMVKPSGEKSPIPYTLERYQEKTITEKIPVYSEVLIKANKTKESNSTDILSKTITGYTDKVSIVEDKIKTDSLSLKEILKAGDGCQKVTISGTLTPGQAMDNILVIDGHAYSEFAWWNSSYIQRIPINCSNVATGTPVLINGSAGFTYNGSSKNVVWTRCEPDLYLYFFNTTKYAVANQTSIKAFEVEVGTSSSYNITDVWDSNYIGVYHLSSLDDSSKANNDMTLPTNSVATLTSTNCQIGNCYSFSQNAAYPSGMISASTFTFSDARNLGVEAFALSTSSSQYDTIATLEGTRTLGLSKYPDGSYSWFVRSSLGDADRIDSASNNYYNYHSLMVNSSGFKWKQNNNVTLLDKSAHIEPSSGGYLHIGEVTINANDPWAWTGIVDEVRISNVARNDAYIEDVMNNFRSLPGYASLAATAENVSVPTLVFDSQQPFNITLANSITNVINLTFNYTLLNVSTFRVYLSTNNSDNVKDVVNGTGINNPTAKSCINISETQIKCPVYDNEILRGIYNLNQSYMENTAQTPLKTFNNNGDRLKQEYKTIITEPQSFIFFEFNCNGTAGDMLVYFYNSSNQSSLLASIPALSAFDHCHSSTSCHHVVGIPVNQSDYTINGVKITPTFYAEIRGTPSSSFSCYGVPVKSRNNALMASTNAVTYTELTATLDAHVHRFGNYTYFRYYAEAQDLSGNTLKSAEVVDLLEPFNLPPSTPYLFDAQDVIQNETQAINWTASNSPNPGATITAYNLTLWQSLALVRQLYYGSALTFAYNATDALGNYTLKVTARDSLNLTSTAFENALFEIGEPCFPIWSCSAFGSCLPSNLTLCSAVSDANLCGQAFAGNLTDYNQNCTYIPPLAPGDSVDLNTTEGALIFGILIFLWIALLVLTLVFRHLGIALLCWVVGVFIGLALGTQYSAMLGLMFLLMESVILLMMGKLRSR